MPSSPPETARFSIVTPVLNGAGYIDETIASVLSQAGNFSLHYHIQDGGSTDGSLEKIAKWLSLHKSGLLPVLCQELIFTFATEPDHGIYDAVNKGFAHSLPPGPHVLMGWIASDDKMAPGAFATVAAVRHDVPDIRFMGGRVSVMNEVGSIINIAPVMAFPRTALAAGLHDGRALYFMMQEGTFWCADIWHTVGGLDAAFRLAGDWALWRKLAKHAAYFSIDSVLGFHRKRPGQASSDISRYYREIDAVLGNSVDEKAEYDRLQGELASINFSSRSFSYEPHCALAVYYDGTAHRWGLTTTPSH